MQLDMGTSLLNISDAKLREWEATYKVDVKNEILRATKWWSKQPPSKTRWKTLRGMEAWLERAESSQPRNNREVTTSPSESSHPALVAERGYRGEGEAKYLPNDAVRSLLSDLRASL